MAFKRIINLTYPIHEGIFKYPSDAEPEINIKEAQIQNKEEVIYDESGCSSGVGVIEQKYKSGHIELKIRNHHGTHIDAPAHKIPGGKTIDDYEISKFINQAKLIDLTSTDLLQRKKRKIKLEDIKEEIDKSKGLGTLVFYTGFCDEMFHDEIIKLTGEAKKEFEKTFPYFSINAAKYIADNSQGLNIVGIDSFAVDPSGSNSEVHRTFFAKDILPLETLVNLSALKNSLNPQTNAFQLVCAPLLYKRADAAQTRAYAVIE